jgi:GT2 family glycosyltransferase
MEPETSPPAPAVVAVVVTCDPGSWFEQALQSLASQDYPNLSVLVIDAASQQDPTPRVAAIMPGAFVTRLDQRVGFGRACNEALKIVDGASHLLLCHDDVALAPDAARLLVEEAFRQNAGVATPKFVEWDRPDRLLAVGATTDKVGVVQDLVERGELDQEQHDMVREVFLAPGGVTLVRADLFSALGGFDEVVDQFGEDLDLSWRARVAGARVVVVPAARVRHRRSIAEGERAGWTSPADRRRAERLTEEHRLRTVLSCYRWFDLAWIAPLALLFVIGEAVTRLLQGRPGDAAAALGSFVRAFRQPGRLWRARRQVQRRRRVGDRQIRRLQVRGNARFRAFVRARIDDVREGLPPAPIAIDDGDDDDDDDEDGYLPTRARPHGGAHRPARFQTSRVFRAGDQAGALTPIAATPPEPTEEVAAATAGISTNRRVAVITGIVIVALMVFGSRGLLNHELPAVGQLPNLSGGWSSIWRSYWSTWQQSGLGVSAASSPALALLGIGATICFGGVGLLQHVVVLGPLLVGPFGAYRAARWWGSRRGRLAALIAYAIVPLPYDALAHGHWPGLLAYAAAPWVLGMLIRLSGEIPLPTSQPRHIGGRVIGLGILVALVASAAPAWLLVVPVVGVALLAGSALVGRPLQGVRMLAVSVAASVVAVILLLPWSPGVLGRGTALLGVAPGAAGRLSLPELLRFDTGPVGKGPLGWAFLIAAALPLVVGREWRLAWATRLWVVAIVCFWIGWAGLQGWLPTVPIELILAPAAAALAGSVALGAVAFELDLPGYRFGWRQLAAAVAGVALAVAAVPMLIGSGDGRWHLPGADASSVLAFLPNGHAGDYRVLWVGAPDALPLAGESLGSGVAYGTSFDGEPTVADQWAPGRAGAMPVLGSDLHLVEHRLTTKLGHLLAPMAVRYIVVPLANAPSGEGAATEASPASFLVGLQLQTDLQLVNVDPNYVVYENAAWAPARMLLPASAEGVAAQTQAGGVRSLQETALAGGVPVLTGGTATRASGYIDPADTAGRAQTNGSSGEVYVSAQRDAGWRLHLASGGSVSPQPAFGWAMAFPLPSSTPTRATLEIPAAGGLRAMQIVEIVLWVAAIGLVAVDVRRRRSEHPPSETVQAEWFIPMAAASARGTWQPSGGALGPEDITGDEVWIDV